MDGCKRIVIVVWLVFTLSATGLKIQTTEERRNLATKNPGFISIDCGVNEDYVDEITGLSFKSDTDFVSTGQNGDISPEFDNLQSSFARLFRNLRYFPQGRRNCYSLKPEQGKNNNYLIEVYFKYGNYDGKNEIPRFDLYLGVHYWATVQLASSGDSTYYVLIHFSPTDVISVCLVNTGSGIPFISALELRSLSNSIYRTDTGFAGVIARFDVGNFIVDATKYKDDIYDRMWRGYKRDNWVLVNTTQTLDFQGSNDSYKVPSEVLRTAVQPPANLSSLSFSVNYTNALRYFNVYFYFAEVQRIPEGLKREFTITLNSVRYGPIAPQYLKPLTVVCEKAQLVEGSIQFSIDSTVQSDLPPILNGFEILASSISNASATNPEDVGAINAIMRKYNLDRLDWQGDPCVPRDLSWSGLNCTIYNNEPRITSLSLSSSALSGKIATEFSNLQALQFLDLSNNKLTGLVPEFLGELSNLVMLNLTGNQLTGPLPQSLMEKSKNGTLNISFDLKPNPCANSSCKRKRPYFLVPALSSIIIFLVLVIFVILVIFWRTRRNRVIGSGGSSILISKNRSFAYSEIVSMTNDFESIIGEGGFGKVYLGELNDGTQVAVKLLSQSSKQGFKEFQSEVQLLIMVYHRNLVTLIGYCNDDGNIALVYEYMENGNLREHLSGKRSYVLNWKERLQIAVEAAQGLEYLHNGCKPPIVHRDLKTSNILLNENLVAKISDFGLSRVFATDIDTHVSTAPAGTFGYVDPEFYVTGNLNKKSDVYSFGIILFELITGQPVAIRGEEYSTHILNWVTPIIKNGDIHSTVDQRLEGQFNTNSAWKAVEIAMSCVPTTAIQRPDMGDVLVELKECLAMVMASEGSQRMKSIKTRSTNALEMSYIDFDTEVTVR